MKLRIEDLKVGDILIDIKGGESEISALDEILGLVSLKDGSFIQREDLKYFQTKYFKNKSIKFEDIKTDDILIHRKKKTNHLIIGIDTERREVITGEEGVIEEKDLDRFWINKNNDKKEAYDNFVKEVDSQDEEKTLSVMHDFAKGLKFHNKEEQKNNGLKNSFYKIPDWIKDLDDLSEYLKLDPYEFNILKTLWIHLGDRHDGTNEAREVNKCIHYSEKRLKKLNRDG